MSDLEEALVSPRKGRGGGGVVPYMGHIGMFHSEGYDFQAVYSGIGYKESLNSRTLINWLKILVYTRQTGNCHSKIKSKARSCCYSTKDNQE